MNKGDRLAEIDREEMLTRLEDFKTTVSQTEAAMKTLDAQREVIKKTQAQTIRDAVADVDKASLDLKTTPVVSRIAAEQLRLSTEQAEATHKQIMGEVPLMETSLAAQWRMAELALGERTLELKRVQANLDRMTMRAPISGLVVMGTTRRGGEIGQIREGDSLDSGESLMKVVDLSSMIVEASVNQVDAELIRIGAKARVHFDAFPDLEVPAEVYSIGALSKSASSQGRAEYVKGVPITLRLLKVDPRVIPDLSVGVDVVLAREPQTVIAPREAIFQDAPESKPFVFVQQDPGWVRREVELGPANYVSTAVRSGLRAGEVVACERPRNQTAGKK